jgi:serine/threonine protein kinase
MAAPKTTAELAELVRRSGLIAAKRLDDVLAPQSPHETRPPQLAKRLVAAGLLTQFQAEQFLLGKWRGFTIGKYKVLEKLGFGGNGTVYLCEHMTVRRRVAVKVLPSAKATNPASLGRFYREARAAGVLDHPNLVKAYDVDEENGLHFLVMDYVDGASLQELVARHGPLSVARASHYIRQAARGLHAAHQAGLVHRDMKPSNIMVDRTGTVRVLDLGLARFFADENDLLTLKYDEKVVLGTADYVSPEQALNSHGVDIRADVYSLGCTFYFVLTGRPPFCGTKAAQKLIAHQTQEPLPIREQRPDVPEGLARVIATMMAKDPARRYQTPADLVEALAPYTDKAIAPPAESEMPTLCPAARSLSDPALISPPARPPYGIPNAGARAASTTRPGFGRKPRTMAEMATPNSVNTDTPTTGAELAPQAFGWKKPVSMLMPTPTEKVGKLRRLSGILAASILIGVLLRWSITRKQYDGPPPAQTTSEQTTPESH